ncbi:hypothetical protein ACGFIF_44285 [Kribbella sp. NPDC049174]|uniref:hypothetical protein n=1 Tax=Kribbella sp. NPDC049174 TaxID=3364112 RepID=UPI003722463B
MSDAADGPEQKGPEKDDPPRPIVLSVAISILAVSFAIAHLAWPNLRIDSITIVLLIVALLPWLGQLFESLDIFGVGKVEFREFRREVHENLREGRRSLDTVTERVDQLAEMLVKGAVTPEHAQQLRTALTGFYLYVKQLFPQAVASAVPGVTVVPEADMDVATLAYFNQEENEIVLSVEVSNNTFPLFREYCHSVLWGAPGQALDPAALPVESGLANYLCASYGDDPRLGDETVDRHTPGYGKLRINLENHRRFPKIKDPFNPFGPEAWGGAFWDLRKVLGAPSADRLLATAWRETDYATSEFAKKFAATVIAGAAQSDSTNTVAVTSVFEQRGLSAI